MSARAVNGWLNWAWSFKYFSVEEQGHGNSGTMDLAMAKWIQLQAQFALLKQQSDNHLDEVDNKAHHQPLTSGTPLDFSLKSTNSSLASLASLMMESSASTGPQGMPTTAAALQKMTQLAAAATQRSPITPTASTRFQSLPMLTLPCKSTMAWPSRWLVLESLSDM